MELQPSEPNCLLVPGQEPSLTPQLIAKFRQRVDTQEMCIEQGGFGRVRRPGEMGLGTASFSRLSFAVVLALYLLNPLGCHGLFLVLGIQG